MTVSVRRRPRILTSPIAWTGLIGIFLLLMTAVLAPILFEGSATTRDPANILLSSSPAHWLGTDALGRDVLARILVAARLSLVMAVGATLLGVTLGLTLGFLPHVGGPRLRHVIVSLIDLSVAFPALLLAMFVLVVLGRSTVTSLIAVALAGVPFIARLTYSLTAGVINRDFVLVSEMLGVPRPVIVVRHVLPNIAEPLILTVVMTVGGNLVAFAALSFLGLGVQPPEYDWGNLLNAGLQRFYIDPAQALGAAFAVTFAGVSFSLVGEAGSLAASRNSVAKKIKTARVPLRPPACEAADQSDVLTASELTIAIPWSSGEVEAVRGVSLRISQGESVGIVGESGSGKSLTALGIASLLSGGSRVASGAVTLIGRDVYETPTASLRHHLRKNLAVVFQDPMTALNPVMSVGAQLVEMATVDGADKRNATARAIELLGKVQIPDPAQRFHQLPHEMSGGMRQRVIIAMALMLNPKVIIADEATTALDVTVQAQVLDLFDVAKAELGVSIIMISHDLGVIAERCDRALVMYGGMIVEDLPTGALDSNAAHPYTRGLRRSIIEMSDIATETFATIPGQPLSPAAYKGGCPFAPRCELADDRCRSTMPPAVQINSSHTTHCWKPHFDTVRVRERVEATKEPS